jgi:transcriptional regulator with XRE-family HTH domain
LSIFGSRLKLIRIEQNLQQKDIAKLLNMGVSTISNYETGTSSPDIEKLTRISKLLNVSTDYLLGLSELKNSNLSISEALLSQEIKNNNINIYDIEYLKKMKKDFNGLPEDIKIINKAFEILNLSIKDFIEIFLDNKKGE